MVVILEDKKDLNVKKEKLYDKLKKALLQLTALQTQVRLITLGKLTFRLSYYIITAATRIYIYIYIYILSKSNNSLFFIFILILVTI